MDNLLYKNVEWWRLLNKVSNVLITYKIKLECPILESEGYTIRF